MRQAIGEGQWQARFAEGETVFLCGYRARMEGRRHCHAPIANANHRASLGEEPQRGVDQLRSADVLVENRREMDALRRDRRVARMGSAADYRVELRACAQPAGFCEVV